MSNATNNTLGSLLPQMEAAANSDSLYGDMVPNLRFNVTMIVIWGILLGIQVIQVIMRQYWFTVAFICTGILEVIGYVGRTCSHYNVASLDPFPFEHDLFDHCARFYHGWHLLSTGKAYRSVRAPVLVIAFSNGLFIYFHLFRYHLSGGPSCRRWSLWCGSCRWRLPKNW